MSTRRFSASTSPVVASTGCVSPKLTAEMLPPGKPFVSTRRRSTAVERPAASSQFVANGAAALRWSDSVPTSCLAAAVRADELPDRADEAPVRADELPVGADEPPVYFRAMRGNPGEQFQRLAERYGVPFSPEFSVQDSIQSTDYAPRSR